MPCLFSISFIFGQLVFLDLCHGIRSSQIYHVADCHHQQIKHIIYTIILEVLYYKRASRLFESMTTGVNVLVVPHFCNLFWNNDDLSAGQ